MYFAVFNLLFISDWIAERHHPLLSGGRLGGGELGHLGLQQGGELDSSVSGGGAQQTESGIRGCQAAVQLGVGGGTCGTQLLYHYS